MLNSVKFSNPVTPPCSCISKTAQHNYNSTIDMVGGLMVLARVFPSEETDFAQILLPVALSYETFLCKMCVALRVDKDTVKKVVRLPDVLIRSTEDVCRLEPYDKLEVRIKRKNPIAKGVQKCVDATKKYGPGLIAAMGLLLLAGIAVNQQIMMGQLQYVQTQVHDIKWSPNSGTRDNDVDVKLAAVEQELKAVRVDLYSTVQHIHEMYAAFSKCEFEEVEEVEPTVQFAHEQRKNNNNNNNNNNKMAQQQRTGSRRKT